MLINNETLFCSSFIWTFKAHLLLNEDPSFLTCLVAQMVVCLQCRRPRFDPWVRKISWRRTWQPTPVFLPEKSHGFLAWRAIVQRSQWVGHDWAQTAWKFTPSLPLPCFPWAFLTLTTEWMVNVADERRIYSMKEIGIKQSLEQNKLNVSNKSLAC